MIVKKDASLVIDLIQKVVPKQLLEKDGLVIAGGAPLHWYVLSEMLSEQVDGIRDILKVNESIMQKIMAYNDIDFWALKNSEAEKMILFSNTEPKDYKNPKGFLKDVLTISNGIKKDVISVDGISFYHQKSSFWANTFVATSFSSKPQQFVKNSPDSIESLLDSFDLGICSCALYKGEFYLHHTFLESLEKKEILINNKDAFKNKLFANRVFHAIRFFKYYKKTSFPFSKELNDHVISTLLDADKYKEAMLEFNKSKNNSILKQNATLNSLFSIASVKLEGQEKEQDKDFVLISTSNGYEQRVGTKHTIFRMCEQLECSLEVMSKMKNFDKTSILFFDDNGFQNPSGVYKKVMGIEQGSVSIF